MTTLEVAAVDRERAGKGSDMAAAEKSLSTIGSFLLLKSDERIWLEFKVWEK